MNSVFTGETRSAAGIGGINGFFEGVDSGWFD